ncbi:polysaccharide pyruvyl transferase CsaB [Anaerosalibacter bizertensis]|uniref:polysaccharide pyruvyl transferase CsaB n=1 Tax=Anaerosalibacter bizertensis TaxID=932217 RepID=UPI0035137BF2
MSREMKILISGYYGFDNSGDDAILKAIVKDFKHSSDNVELVALSNRPSNTEKTYNIKSINRFNIKEVIKTIKSCDLFISGGGSLLQDVTSTRSILYYLALMNKAKRCKKSVMVYANGIGPINKRLNRFLTKKVLNKVDLITLRDEDSKRFLEELGVDNPNIHVTADPVFTLEPSSKDRVLDIFKVEKIPIDKPLIGISIRRWNNTNDLVRKISNTIEYILNNYDVNVILIPMHYPEDLELSKEVKKRVNEEGCYIINDKYTVEDIMGIIKELEMIIAMRLHSLIYAATQETPMVGLIYDPKVEGFLNFIDMDYMCHVDNMEIEELCDNIDEVWSKRKYIRYELGKTNEVLKQKAMLNTSMALDLLRSR